MNEAWRDIGFANYTFKDGYILPYGKYMCSDLGRVMRTKIGRILNNHWTVIKNRKTYQRVNLSLDKTRTMNVHVLVAKLFISGGVPGFHVNHKNPDRENPEFNWASNLEWLTVQQNHDHANKLGINARGEKVPQSKLKSYDVAQIKVILKDTNWLHREIAEMYGVSVTTIGNVARGTSWKHIEI